MEAWRLGGGGYLDGGDVERRGDAKDGHDDRLVLLVDEDLHLSDVPFSRHLRDVLVGHVGFPGPEAIQDSKIFFLFIKSHEMAVKCWCGSRRECAMRGIKKKKEREFKVFEFN